MAKEWILNIATNRWQFNRPKYVGKVSEEIRKCQPKRLDDWISFYKQNVKPKKFEEMKKHIKNLTIDEYLDWIGSELCKKIHEVMKKEIEEISEDDCKNYIRDLIFKRTYEGYITEKETIYGLLESVLGIKIEPAPDEWDRRYNIDFYIKAKKGYIGIQIKPITYNQTPEIHNWLSWLKESHNKFEREVGGKAFVVFSVKKGGKKDIYNQEVIEDIRRALEELGGIP
ncbi:MAG: MjaI family restriction endonuclease [Aquificae bacterium]|nr:MjaI family restriction endonuclease [Aquificota bacterium]